MALMKELMGGGTYKYLSTTRCNGDKKRQPDNNYRAPQEAKKKQK